MPKKRPLTYRIDENHEVHPCEPLEMGKCLQEESLRRVGRDELPDGRVVSTVFLGVDHALYGAPELFETQVFRPRANAEDLHCGIDFQTRFCCWRSAQQGHAAVLEAFTDGSEMLPLPFVCTECYAKWEAQGRLQWWVPEGEDAESGEAS